MLIYNLWYIFFDCIVIHDQSRRIYDFKVKHTKSIIERKVAPAKCFTRTRCCEITQTCVYVLPANTSNPVDNPMGLPIVCDFVFNVTTWLPPGLRQSSWYICCLRHKKTAHVYFPHQAWSWDLGCVVTIGIVIAHSFCGTICRRHNLCSIHPKPC